MAMVFEDVLNKPSAWLLCGQQFVKYVCFKTSSCGMFFGLTLLWEGVDVRNYLYKVRGEFRLIPYEIIDFNFTASNRVIKISVMFHFEHHFSFTAYFFKNCYFYKYPPSLT